jgi:hypothetical protein
MIYRTKFQNEAVEIEYGLDAYGMFYIEGAWYVPSEVQLNSLEQHSAVESCKVAMIEALGWQFSTLGQSNDKIYDDFISNKNGK